MQHYDVHHSPEQLLQVDEIIFQYSCSQTVQKMRHPGLPGAYTLMLINMQIPIVEAHHPTNEDVMQRQKYSASPVRLPRTIQLILSQLVSAQ